MEISPDGEIIMVDDDSPDGTAEEARRYGRDMPLTVIVRKNERGLATAVLRGFEAARGDLIAVMDADLSHRPADLAMLYHGLMEQQADLVVGSRFVQGGGSEDWTRVREFISFFARMLGRGLVPVRDLTSGFFMFRRRILDGVPLSPVGYKICLEILVKSRAERVAEVPITFRQRMLGQSKLDSAVTLAYLRHLLSLYFWVLRKAGPGRHGPTVTFARFTIVGFSGILINIGLLAVFWKTVQWPLLTAAAAAIEGSILTNFLFNHFWTWRGRGEPGVSAFLGRALRYQASAGLSAFSGNWLAFWLLVSGLHFPVWPAYGIGIFLSIVLGFILSDRFRYARNVWEGR